MPHNTVYGPNLTALIQTAVAREWVDRRCSLPQFWRRIEIETGTLLDPRQHAEDSAAKALALIRQADLLMLGLA